MVFKTDCFRLGSAGTLLTFVPVPNSVDIDPQMGIYGFYAVKIRKTNLYFRLQTVVTKILLLSTRSEFLRIPFNQTILYVVLYTAVILLR